MVGFDLGLGLGLTTRGGARDPLAALFGPADNGYIAAAKYWRGNAFQDSEGSVPATIGDPVGLLKDRSPNDDNFSQSTNSKRPVLSLDGVSYLSLNAVNSQFLSASYQLVTGDFTILLALRGAATNQIIGATNGSAIVYVGFALGKPTAQINGSTITADDAVTNTDNVIVARYRKSANFLELRLNGAVIGTASPTSSILPGVFVPVGGYNNAGTVINTLSGRLYAQVIIDRYLSAQECHKEEVFLASLCSDPPAIVTAQRDIMTLGDSRLTSQLGPVTPLGTLYPTRSVFAEALSGQRSDEIMGRFLSGTSLSVADDEIPASGSVLTTDLAPDLFHALAVDCAIHGEIAGIHGTLVYTHSTASVTFTRDADGNVLPVEDPISFIPDSATAYNTSTTANVSSLATLYSDLAIIGFGYNDIYNDFISGSYTYSRTAVLERIQQAVEALREPRQFIITGIFKGEYLLVNGGGGLSVGESSLGVSPSLAATRSALDEIAALNTALQTAYPDNYLDLQAEYEANGFGETATVDTTDYTILNSTLLPDGVHASSTEGKLLTATIIQTKMFSLGYAP